MPSLGSWSISTPAAWRVGRGIELGSRRAAAELVDDVRVSGRRLADAWASVPSDAWERGTVDVNGRVRRLAELPGRRWQELEVHLIDLQIGVSYNSWSDEFVAARLPVLRAEVAARLVDAGPVSLSTTLSGREEVAWLYGRLHRADLPLLRPWA